MTVEILAAATLAALIALGAWRWYRHRVEEPPRMESWLEGFSPGSYLPMLRLSEPGDTGFLTTHRGPEEAARYRRLRRKILREYLRCLSRDFHRLQNLASQKSRSRSHDGNSSLAHVEENLEFILSVWSIELRLLIDEVVPCAVNLRPLLANLQELTEKTREASRRQHGYRL